MKVVVLGCGAMGSVYAAGLVSVATELWVVDTWQEHVDAIRASGLRVEGPLGDRTVQVNATTEPADVGAGSADLVVVATKASGVAAAAATASMLLSPDGVVLTIQNGLGAGARIAQHVPPEKVLLGIASNFGASMKGPGHAEHKSMKLICIGEMAGVSGTGPSARLVAVEQLWKSAGFDTQACADINAAIWEKFVCNCTFSASTTLTGLTVGEVMDDPNAWSVALSCAEEVAAVAKSQGIKLKFDDVEEFVAHFGSSVRAAKPSMLQDHEARRRSEVDALNGAVAAEARKVGLRAPVNEAVANLIRARESSFGGLKA